MNASGTFWTRKYRQHIASMIGLCYRYVPDRATAEDLAHDAFLRAIEKADTLRMTERFGTWLTRITLNTVMNHLRENGRMTAMDAEEIASDIPEPDSDLTPKSMLEAIRQADLSRNDIVEAIAQLPEHHRTVLNLYVFEKLNHRQIADKLGISSNTSKSHLMRARKELQIILFNKTKQKNRLLMTPIIPLLSADAAFDRYCRRQISSFALPPQRSLNTANLTPSTSKLPLRMRYHALRVPVAAGLGTAAVGAMLIPAPHRQPQPPAPIHSRPAPVVALRTPASDTIAVAEMTETPTETVLTQLAKRSTLHEQQEEELNPEDPPDTAAATPVVVKKIMRRSNRTIVIKDSNKR